MIYRVVIDDDNLYMVIPEAAGVIYPASRKLAYKDLPEWIVAAMTLLSLISPLGKEQGIGEKINDKEFILIDVTEI